MTTLHAIYLGLLVYGAGALALSLSGLFGQGHDQGDGGNEGDDVAAAEHDAGHDAADEAGHDAGHQDGEDGDQDGGARAGSSIAIIERSRRGDAGARAASRVASFLRSSVYLSLGAGATGLFAASRGIDGLAGAAWALGAGAFVLAIARISRRVLRRDLDSSFKNDEFLLEEGRVVVPAAAGQIGKAEVRKYGASVELYVKASDASSLLSKGERVRIVDFDDDCYFVEKLPGATGIKED